MCAVLFAHFNKKTISAHCSICGEQTDPCTSILFSETKKTNVGCIVEFADDRILPRKREYKTAAKITSHNQVYSISLVYLPYQPRSISDHQLLQTVMTLHRTWQWQYTAADNFEYKHLFNVNCKLVCIVDTFIVHRTCSLLHIMAHS